MMIMSNFEIKIIDFGFSTRVRDEQNQPIFSTEILGSPGYKAPEIDLEPYRGEKVDTFAIGVILFILCFRQYPFDPDKPVAAYENYLNDKDGFWSQVENDDAELRHLLDAIFEEDPNLRIDITGILAHSWCQKAGTYGHLEQVLSQLIESTVQKVNSLV